MLPSSPQRLVFASLALFATGGAFPSATISAQVNGASRRGATATGPATRPATTRPSDPAAVDGEEPLWDDSAQQAVLTTAADVRALPPDQAAAGRAVRIRGTITYLAAVPPLMFVQDSTGGVCVSAPRDREARLQMRYGTTVQVEGVTARGGNDIPYVTSADAGPIKITVIAPGTLPPARPAALSQLATPALHGETIDVDAVVRSVRVEPLGPTGPTATILSLAQGASRAEAVVLGRAGEAITAEQYVGATVRVRGVFNAASPPRQEIAAMRLLLRNVRDLRVREPATRAADLPLTPIGDVDDAADAPSAAMRIRVRGVVTLVLPGRGMFVQDPSGGVWVETPADGAKEGEEGKGAPGLRPGDGVDVAGFPGRRGWSGVLTDVTWQVTGRAPLPEAPLVTAEQALDRRMDGRLVRVDALVLSVARLSEHTTLVLQSEGRVFLARLADPAVGPPPAVSEGSWVRATGVCVQTPLEGLAAAAAGATVGAAKAASTAPASQPDGRPPSFYLLLASDRSVDVTSAPGWWTLRRVLVVCGLLAAVALAAMTWVVALRRRVTRQTGLIREHLAKRTLYEERVRIARDLHDSLEQDLLGITMQLNATEKLLTQPERAKQSLHLAAAMVRRSQAETHRAVWDLRDQRPGQDGLVAAIREAVVGLSTRHVSGDSGDGAADGPRVGVEVNGEPRDLPPQTENHLLRVALEALTNAVKHARATRIDVRITFAEDRVELAVCDDGRGFDAEHLPPPSSGHFGLFGMSERAEKLGAALTIRSSPGGGTEIRLGAPVEPVRPAEGGADGAPVATGAPGAVRP